MSKDRANCIVKRQHHPYRTRWRFSSCFGPTGSATRLLRVSGGSTSDELSGFTWEATRAQRWVWVTFLRGGVKTLTQIHGLPGAMSCLLRCEGLLHPCVVIRPSLEYSYVMEFLMWSLCDASHWFDSSSPLPQTSSERFVWRLLSALTSLAFSHLAGNRWVWHGESAPTVLFPWSVSCDVTLLRLHMKLKCHWNLTKQKNRILLSRHFKTHPFGLTLQNLLACFPESFLSPSSVSSCFSQFFQAPAFLFSPPGVLFRDVSHHSLGVFFFLNADSDAFDSSGKCINVLHCEIRQAKKVEVFLGW